MWVVTALVSIMYNTSGANDLKTALLTCLRECTDTGMHPRSGLVKMLCEPDTRSQRHPCFSSSFCSDRKGTVILFSL